MTEPTSLTPATGSASESPSLTGGADESAPDGKNAKPARSMGPLWMLMGAAGRYPGHMIGAALARVRPAWVDVVVIVAGLAYFTNTTDPATAKFYGDVQSEMTDTSAHLLFFALELNRIDDALIEDSLKRDPRAAHYTPWIHDLRLDRPFQLEDRIEQLFHEKSMTGHAAWNRLFDETMSSLEFTIDDEQMPLENTLSLLQDADGAKRKKAGQALAATFKDNLRTFTLITNTLAKDKEISDRWRGFEDIADSRHLANRVERPVVDALAQAVREACPRLSHRYYAMKAKWLGLEKLEFWDRNAPLPETPRETIPWDEAKNTVLSAYHSFSPEMADIARRFFDRSWIDAPSRPGKISGAFAHPTVQIGRASCRERVLDGV